MQRAFVAKRHINPGNPGCNAPSAISQQGIHRLSYLWPNIMSSQRQQKPTAMEKQELEFIQQLHLKEPALSAAQLIERLKAHTGRQPSKLVLRAIGLHVDPYKEAREVISWKGGR
ncbi:hypothetical protein F5Y13DRAFT_166170 [Hypoxylon sp. FL1857]|nr:hypothetical protein F5Y13DRAFT_166170 [Hypoxylon sp. FL1857]